MSPPLTMQAARAATAAQAVEDLLGAGNPSPNPTPNPKSDRSTTCERPTGCRSSMLCACVHMPCYACWLQVEFYSLTYLRTTY